MDPSTTQGKRILVVDDDDGIRMMLENKLGKSGYKTALAGNGLHGLQKLRGAETFDLVICDLKMPGMSGIEFIKQMRQDPQLKTIPVLLVTGYPEKQLMMEAVKAGISRVLLKPFKQNQILELIEEVLKNPTAQIPNGTASSSNSV